MVQNNFGDKVIDLSNPPSSGRYVHQEYPKLLYKFGAKPLSVKSEAEEAEAVADGWGTKPVTEAPGGIVKELQEVTEETTEASDETGAAQEFKSYRKRK